VTVSLKARFGFTVDLNLIRSPGAIVPSIPSTAGFQVAQLEASVSRFQMVWGSAAIRR
jgi:hypothetical protein